MLVDDPEGRIAGATEEILRWASPVMYFRRNATKDFELRGQTIKAGEKISLWYISGNRDEDIFDDPFTFDITRDPNPHIAFGGGGPHFCLGAQLARMEIHVLFEELAKRVPARRAARRARAPALELHRRDQAPPGALPRGLATAAAPAGRRRGGDVVGHVTPAAEQHHRADEHERRHDQERLGEVALRLAVEVPGEPLGDEPDHQR